MAEWLKAVDSKSTVPLWHRGFKSLSLRHRPAHVCGVWRGARAVESARLESAWAPKVLRGFESHPLRSQVVVLGGEVAVPCNPQSATAGRNSQAEAPTRWSVPSMEGVEDWVLCDGGL